MPAALLLILRYDVSCYAATDYLLRALFYLI